MTELQLQKKKEYLESIEEEISKTEAEIKLGDDIIKLMETPAYKSVIEQGYMEDEAQRICSLLTTPMNFKKEKNDVLVQKLTSIRNLREYIKSALLRFESAKDQLEYLKSSRSDVDNYILSNYPDTYIENVETEDIPAGNGY